MHRYRLGVDIGGTFTDLVLYDKKTRSFHTHKTLTTPDNLAEGVMQSISKYVRDFNEIEYFVHGTTSGLNALLERKGAKVALITTEGFRDVYEIGRANRVDMYNIQYKKPAPLVDREHIYEMAERVSYDGEILQPIDKEEVNKLVNSLKKNHYEAVAVCFLHSYRNPIHEQAVRELIEKELNIPVSLSSDIAREWREYERTSTTIMNAYIAPIVRKYLNKLETMLTESGYTKDIYIMQSNGGVMTSKVAKQLPLQTLMSGPVGGTIGGANLSALINEKNLICVDMGGTSFDVSMTIDGEPDITAETMMEGFPLLSPMVNIHTIGAGGGSIAYTEGGGLRVGPESAGSYPGPACYGNGGKKPTVTDANLILGRIDPDHFLGGGMKLDKEAAYKAIQYVADEIGLSVEETAEGICNIANAKMADAIRTLTVRKGIDPRDFTMVAFGGAGPMHAVMIAESLGIQKIFVPNTSGTFSAWGMLQTDIRFDSVRNDHSLLLSVDKDRMHSLYEEMKEECMDMMRQQHISSHKIRLQKSMDVRYVGQEYTINIVNHSDDPHDLERLFHQAHFEIYGHHNPDNPTEIVNLRMTAIGDLEKLEFHQEEDKDSKEVMPKHTRETFWSGEAKRTGIYSTADLMNGNNLTGPAIIEDQNTTIVIPPKYAVLIDENKNIQIEKIFIKEEVYS